MNQTIKDAAFTGQLPELWVVFEQGFLEGETGWQWVTIFPSREAAIKEIRKELMERYDLEEGELDLTETEEGLWHNEDEAIFHVTQLNTTPEKS